MNLPPELINELMKHLKLREVEICYRTDPMFRVLGTAYLKQLLKSRKKNYDLENSIFAETDPELVETILREELVGYVDSKVWVKKNQAGEIREIKGLNGKKPYLWRWEDAPTAIQAINKSWICPGYVMWIPSAIKDGYRGQEKWIPAIDWLRAVRYHCRRYEDGTPRSRVPFNRGLFKNKACLTKDDILGAGLDRYSSFSRFEEDAEIIELKSRQVLYFI